MAKAKPKQPETFDLSVVEQATQHDLSDAEELRAELLKSLAAGKDVQAELDAIDQEISEHNRKLRRFGDARRAAAQANTATAKAERHDATMSQLATAYVDAEQLVELTLRAQLKLEELGAILTVVEDQRAKVLTSLQDTASASQAGAPRERIVLDTFDHIRQAVQAATLPAHFMMALWNTGLGRKGVHLGEDAARIPFPRVDVSDPTGDAQKALTRIRSLAERIAVWSATANDITEKEVA